MTKHETIIDKIDHEAIREVRNAKRFVDENNWLFVGFVLLLAALVIINASYVINRASHKGQVVGTSAVSMNSILTTSQRAQTSDFEVWVDGVTETAEPDPGFPIGEHQTMLILELHIVNRTAVTQHVIPVNQLFIHDRNGGLAKMQASSKLTSPLASQDVEPGKMVSGQVSFAVLKNETRPLLFVDLGWSSAVPVVFDVLH